MTFLSLFLFCLLSYTGLAENIDPPGHGGPLSEFYLSSSFDSTKFVDVHTLPGATTISTETIQAAGPYDIGFEFPFFENRYTYFYVSKNGMISFLKPATMQVNECPFSNETKVGNVIAPLMQYLDPNCIFKSSTGFIAFSNKVDCPLLSGTHCLGVEFNNIFYEDPPDQFFTFEAILYPSGRIEFRYKDIGTNTKLTVGILNKDKTDFWIWTCNPSVELNDIFLNKVITFIYDPLKDCGNGFCNTGENCLNCEADCGATCEICGDGLCDPDEDCFNCPQDCGECCGNSICETQFEENCVNCPDDCARPCGLCGDSECKSTLTNNEDACSCPEDCPGSCCGDGKCTGTEDCVTCHSDCSPPCRSDDKYTVIFQNEMLVNITEDGAESNESTSLDIYFSFPFYDKFFSSAFIHKNGLVSFQNEVHSSTEPECPFSADDPQFLCAVSWFNVNLLHSTNIYYKKYDSCPIVNTLGNKWQCMIFQWNNIKLNYMENTVSFETIFHENGDITFIRSSDSPLFNISTIGIKGDSVGVVPSFNLLSCGGRGNISDASTGIFFGYHGCGDGICNPERGENCVNCRFDCPIPCGLCGDTFCNATLNETCSTCHEDCGFPEVDTDGDGTPDCLDECFNDTFKNKTAGPCGCGIPDVDTDDDQVLDCFDACPTNPNKISDPGVCGCQYNDDDEDNDGAPWCIDECPEDSSKTEEGYCGCGKSETDSDGDNYPDCVDACPELNGKHNLGICGCESLDVDTDGDGHLDCNDTCPFDKNKWNTTGECGCNVTETDTDGDSVPDCNDPCPQLYDELPGPCGCGVPTTGDQDDDGVLDCNDGCKKDPNKISPGVCGCGNSEIDTDHDLVPDCVDDCPLNPNKTQPGECGCNYTDIDTDGDSTLDCFDDCPLDSSKIEPGICGCGISEDLAYQDSDGDQTPDCLDACPNDPTVITDDDSDGDQVPDCVDECRTDPNKWSTGFCGCHVVDPPNPVGSPSSTVLTLTSVEVAQISCFNFNDGFISVSVSGGESPLRYSLMSSGVVKTSDTGMFQSLGPGTYSVITNDTKGCSVRTPSYSLTNPTPLRLTGDEGDTGTCSSNASVRVRASGGEPPLDYFLRGGGFSQASGDFLDLPPGDYQILVTDARKCGVSGGEHSVLQYNSTQCGNNADHNSPLVLLCIVLLLLF